MAKKGSFYGGFSTSSKQTSSTNIHKHAKERDLYLRSARPKIVCSQTLSIYETKGVIVPKYINTTTRYDEKFAQEHLIVEPLFTYNQYIEALNSLRHNCLFIQLCMKFNKADNNFTINDLKTISYAYPKNLLSSCINESISHTIDIDDLDNAILVILKNSKKIVEDIENSINFKYLTTASQSFEAFHKKNQKLQTQLFELTDKIIENIETNKLQFTGLRNIIKSHTKTSSLAK